MNILNRNLQRSYARPQATPNGLNRSTLAACHELLRLRFSIRLLGWLLILTLAQQVLAQSSALAKKKCTEFGFKSNTTQHSECVRQFLQSSGAGNPLNSADVGNRYVVQVGAFADAARAQEVSLKLGQAGLKTYSHMVDTEEGRRTRVRVGPVTTKAEADQVADKIRRLELPATILTL
jgi:cell division protein FtsN